MKPADFAVKGILIHYRSKLDRNGNSYHAFCYVDTQSGKEVFATCENNVREIPRALAEQYSVKEYYIYEIDQTLSIKEFDSMTAKWNYAGCLGKENAQFIIAELNK